MLTYNYETGKITRDFHLKKVEGSCRRDPDRTVNIGIMCRLCPFYGGDLDWRGNPFKYIGSDDHKRLVKCRYHVKDDEGLEDVVHDIYTKLEEAAITHYYD